MKNGDQIVDIELSTILRECSITRENNYYHYENMCNSTYNIIHTIFGYRKFEEDFADSFTVYYREEEPIGTFKPSYNEFLRKISYFLNTGIKNPLDNEEFTKICDKRIEVLNSIGENDYQTLKKEFPVLYQDFISGIAYMRYLEKTCQTKEEFDTQAHYFYASGLKRSLKNFIPTQVELYKRFVHKRQEYLESTLKKTANRYLKENFDMDKLAMLVIYKCIEKCEQTDNIPTIKKYLSIIAKYLNSKFNFSKAIITDEGYTITIEDITIRYYALQQKIANTIIRVNWQLASEGQERLIEIPKKENYRRIKMNEDEINQLRTIGEERNEIYQNSNYLAKIIGIINTNDYVAYIYPNGEVIMDREYDPERISTANGAAAFHMKAADFETLSKLDKTALKDHPKVERIIHRENWQARVQEIINKKGTVEDREAAKTLIKRLKQK